MRPIINCKIQETISLLKAMKAHNLGQMIQLSHNFKDKSKKLMLKNYYTIRNQISNCRIRVLKRRIQHKWIRIWFSQTL